MERQDETSLSEVEKIIGMRLEEYLELKEIDPEYYDGLWECLLQEWDKELLHQE